MLHKRSSQANGKNPDDAVSERVAQRTLCDTSGQGQLVGLVLDVDQNFSGQVQLVALMQDLPTRAGCILLVSE